MRRIIFIFIFSLIVFQSFGQNIQIDTIVKDDAFIPDKIKLANLIIQTVSTGVKVEIPKLRINETINQDSLILEDIYPGLYDLSFQMKDYKFECFVEVLAQKTVHVLVDVKEKRFESNFIDYKPSSPDSKPENSNQVFIMVEEMPEFPGGALALRKWIKSNVKYPENARRNKITGRVYVGFVINKKGDVEDCKILRSIDADLDKEALRVVNSMPSWKPGKQKGKSVKVSFSFPINFHLHR